jgi:signal transduction histidine kinase
LSNAFKFTGEGGVRLTVSPVKSGWSTDNVSLKNAPAVVAFEVTDTGIGIPTEKQRIIFEAFQQADASTKMQVIRSKPALRRLPIVPSRQRRDEGRSREMS